MNQEQKDYIYNLIYEKRFSIFNRINKEEKFNLFLKSNNINFDFDITIRSVIKFLKNIDDSCLIDGCLNKRDFIGVRKGTERTEYGFKKFCSDECYKKSISNRQIGKGNTCHRMSEKSFKSMCEKNSKIMKDKIKKGEFKPNISNSWHKGNSYLILDNKKIRYRSSWEAFFHICNLNLKYEDIRIEYKYLGKKHNYIVDFIDYENKILYEVKPKSSINIKRNKNKRYYAKKWCKNNNYEYVYITEKWIIENIDKNIDNLKNQPDSEEIIRKLKRYK